MMTMYNYTEPIVEKIYKIYYKTDCEKTTYDTKYSKDHVYFCILSIFNLQNRVYKFE